jgi:hypothetical protein
VDLLLLLLFLDILFIFLSDYIDSKNIDLKFIDFGKLKSKLDESIIKFINVKKISLRVWIC